MNRGVNEHRGGTGAGPESADGGKQIGRHGESFWYGGQSDRNGEPGWGVGRVDRHLLVGLHVVVLDAELEMGLWYVSGSVKRSSKLLGVKFTS